MTLAEAAERYNRKPSTLRRAVLRKTLAAEKIGKTWIVTTEAMDAYVAQLGSKRGRPRKDQPR